MTDLVSGFSKDLIDRMETKLNFKVKHFYPMNEKWGGYDPETNEATGASIYNLFSDISQVDSFSSKK